MALISLLVFCLGIVFGTGAFFRKGGEMLMTYVLFPIGLAVALTSFKVEDIDAYGGMVTRSAFYGVGLGILLRLLSKLMPLYLSGALSPATFMQGTIPLWRLNLKSVWSQRKTPRPTYFQNAREATRIYYHTAVKLGALTTAIDRTRTADGFATLKATFNLTRTNCPEAVDLFNTQMRKPERLAAILRPFINQYGQQSAIGETLIYGMCKVALVDGAVSLAELRLIDMAAHGLGIHPMDTRRIITSAGIRIDDGFSHDTSGWQERMRRGTQFGGRTGRHGSTGETYTQSAPLDERAAHLATLGLPATAKLSDAKKAWRKLAAKYHPDKLVSQNLPADEMAKAEAMMQAINEAYDWLKDHS